jgi:hypothetical protein
MGGEIRFVHKWTPPPHPILQQDEVDDADAPRAMGSTTTSRLFGNTYLATLFPEGVLTGLGLGFLFTPAMAALTPYFMCLRTSAIQVSAA